ncbi:MAG TPA: PAC2 family protein [Dehalococcoidia bacterium]|jgi:proteasome assembly chaperone (PAC2) family protein|nr:PAC2 family protein [Dehalococcoidia bacterium]
MAGTGDERGNAAQPGALIIDELPELREPIIVCAFAGWNDAAQSATGAVRYLVEQLDAPRFAHIDPEEFYVFTEHRPSVRLAGGSQRELRWPANEFHYVRNARLRHDLVLMPGIEPNLHWHAYTTAMLDLAHHVNARMIMMLGGLLADVVHSAPVRLTGSSTNPELLPNWIDTGVRRSRYEGPTGIVGVLSDVCRRAQMPTASIWANVPHYLNVSPNPKTLAALVHRVDRLFDLDLNLAELDLATERFDAQVDEAVSQNADVRRYIRRLQAAAEEQDEEEEEAQPSASAEDLPSASALVQDLEEFLRRRREADTDDD